MKKLVSFLALAFAFVVTPSVAADVNYESVTLPAYVIDGSVSFKNSGDTLSFKLSEGYALRFKIIEPAIPDVQEGKVAIIPISQVIDEPAYGNEWGKDNVFPKAADGKLKIPGGIWWEDTREEIKYKITKIETNAFRGCGGIKEVVFGDGLNPETSAIDTIEGEAFSECTALESVSAGSLGGTAFSFPSSLRVLGSRVFLGTELKGDIYIKAPLRAISSAFSGTKIDSLSIDVVGGVGDAFTIPANAFIDCKSLTDVTIAGVENRWEPDRR